MKKENRLHYLPFHMVEQYMQIISLLLDDKAQETVQHLKAELGVQTDVQVFHRALQLLNTVMASPDKTALVELPEGTTTVLVNP